MTRQKSQRSGAQQGREPAPFSAVRRGFGVYVHWPFCRKKCPYCDFNSHVRDAVDHKRWAKALIRQIESEAERLVTHGGAGHVVGSVFFGGGTPSLMTPETVAAVVDSVRQHWPLTNDVEITLEANPTSVESDRFAAFRQAGINRVSLGVQSLRAADLDFLGRQHSVAEARQAVAVAARHFDRFSFDLIYARPTQTRASWQDELNGALDFLCDLGGDHLSLYQLTIEENTAFHAARRRGELVELDTKSAATLYDLTCETLSRRGLPAYEVSNFARPGAESRHNLIYWRYGDYLGIGPGAHGRVTLRESTADDTGGARGGRKLATRQHRAPEAWLTAVEQKGTACRGSVWLDRRQRFEEMMMMGLRLRDGLALSSLRDESGRGLDDWIDKDTLARVIDAGYLTREGDTLRATDDGRARLDAVLAHLLSAMPD